jgi:hypothetical protein
MIPFASQCGDIAGSIGAQVTDHLALGDLEVEVVESGDVAVTLGESLRSYGRGAHPRDFLLPITTSIRLPACRS